MNKRCFSVKTEEFEKSIKKMNSVRVKQFYENLAKLEAMVQDPKLLPDNARNAESVYGKLLTRMDNKNIYVMEVGFDRMMAVVIEKENEKIFAWFWGGPHEAYNKKLDNAELTRKENNVKKDPEVISQIKNVKENNPQITKDSTCNKIQDLKGQYLEPKDKKKQQFKGSKNTN